jgi:hypothetical protein
MRHAADTTGHGEAVIEPTQAGAEADGRRMVKRIAWAAIVALWFWPLTLGALSSLVLAYLIVIVIRMIAIAPIE